MGYDFTLSYFVCKDSRVQDPAYNELGQKGTQPRAKKAKKPAEGEDEVVHTSHILARLPC